jgi:hypothetical protein
MSSINRDIHRRAANSEDVLKSPPEFIYHVLMVTGTDPAALSVFAWLEGLVPGLQQPFFSFYPMLKKI